MIQRIKKCKIDFAFPAENVFCADERETYNSGPDFIRYNGGAADCKGLYAVNA